MKPRMRVIIDNDFAGDPDGLLQLAHHLLSPSVDIRAVIGSAVRPDDPFDPSGVSADRARERVLEVLELTGRTDIPAPRAPNAQLTDRGTPQRSEAAEAIVAEAMRDDTDLPLYVVFGASLTQLASAFLIEPRIAERLTAVWIGGPEYPGTPPPPGPLVVEYNLNIDITAAQVVFNDSPIPLWQVPRNAYRQTLMSWAELQIRVQPMGELGAYLYRHIDAVHDLGAKHGFAFGETYIAGDSPLVLLTALQSSFEPDPSSSHYDTVPAPEISDDGVYAERLDGRPIRIYTLFDVRLMLEDFYAKLQAQAR
jgi:inosine-uridine nucleoside N-ribohydrolase